LINAAVGLETQDLQFIGLESPDARFGAGSGQQAVLLRQGLNGDQDIFLHCVRFQNVACLRTDRNGRQGQQQGGYSDQAQIGIFSVVRHRVVQRLGPQTI